jgi:hypothetical protein
MAYCLTMASQTQSSLVKNNRQSHTFLSPRFSVVDLEKPISINYPYRYGIRSTLLLPQRNLARFHSFIFSLSVSLFFFLLHVNCFDRLVFLQG